MLHVDFLGRAPSRVVGEEGVVGADDLGFEVGGDMGMLGGEPRDGEVAAEEGGGEVDVLEGYGDGVFVGVGLLDAGEVGGRAEEGGGGLRGEWRKGEG